MKIVATPEVRLYMAELAHVLYFNNYFGYRESAEKYVQELWVTIMTKLPTAPHKPATPYFNRFGKNMRYAAFPKNKQTCWYAFFDIYDTGSEIFYLVRYISNNHTIAQYL